MNLKTGRQHVHMFDSLYELNPADGLVADVFDATFEDNLTFDTAELRYRLSTPNTP